MSYDPFEDRLVAYTTAGGVSVWDLSADKNHFFLGGRGGLSGGSSSGGGGSGSGAEGGGVGGGGGGGGYGVGFVVGDGAAGRRGGRSSWNGASRGPCA